MMTKPTGCKPRSILLGCGMVAVLAARAALRRFRASNDYNSRRRPLDYAAARPDKLMG